MIANMFIGRSATFTKAKGLSRTIYSYTRKNKPTVSQMAQYSRLTEMERCQDEMELDAMAKKIGWISTGGALCTIGAIFGKPFLLLGIVPAVLFNLEDIKVLIRTFPRDMKFLKRYCQCRLTHRRIANGDLTVGEAFKHSAELSPNKVILQVKDQNWRYRDLIGYSNRVSRLMQKYEMTKDDVCGLFMTNSPELMAIVMGTSEVGVVGAVINSKLRRDQLVQAINRCRCKMVIYEDELSSAINEIQSQLNPDVKLMQLRNKGTSGENAFEMELMLELDSEPEVFIKSHHDDPFVCVYNGVETQEPTMITHSKFLFASRAATILLNITDTDKIYSPVSFSHMSGLIFGVGPAITKGIPVVLRPTFSTEDYFKDCYIYNCTVAHYYGHMWKQLLRAGTNPVEKFHPVKSMYGTGVDPCSSTDLCHRYGVKLQEIRDVTLDNCNMVNFEGKPGVVGFLPKWAPNFLFPLQLIKAFGPERIPLRSFTGICELCNIGEPGLLVKIYKNSAPISIPKTHKKITDVLKVGDNGICSKQLYVLDENLYLKEVDGEYNEKTPDKVESIVANLTKKRCAHYVLPVGTNNRELEVLAIEDPLRQLDMKKLSDQLTNKMSNNELPNYVRVVERFDMDGGNEIEKGKLKDQGLLDVNGTYYFDEESNSYKPLSFKN